MSILLFRFLTRQSYRLQKGGSAPDQILPCGLYPAAVDQPAAIGEYEGRLLLSLPCRLENTGELFPQAWNTGGDGSTATYMGKQSAVPSSPALHCTCRRSRQEWQMEGVCQLTEQKSIPVSCQSHGKGVQSQVRQLSLIHI